MGHNGSKYRSEMELSPEQINILLDKTEYSKRDIDEWHARFLRTWQNRKLRKQKFIEAFIQFYEQGKIDNGHRVDSNNEKTALRLGDVFPDFRVKTTIGDIQLYNWMGNSWSILFSHPADFTPVCTTELSRAAKLTSEFVRRNVKCIALSCDSVENHREWIKDLEAYGNTNEPNGDRCQSGEFPFPIIEDTNRVLAKQLGMIDPEEYDSTGLPLTARAVFIIGPDKKLKASILYPASTGRNFDEILRVIDSLQLSARLPVATPVDWKVGQKVMIPAKVKDEDIEKHFPRGIETQDNLPSGKNYIRMTEV